MHVGVDATCWVNRRGYGRHARALLSALVDTDRRRAYTLVIDFPGAGHRFPEAARIRRVEASSPAAEAASARGRRSVRDMVRMARALSDSSFDVVLFPTVYSFVPLWSGARKVVAVHDVIADLYPALTLPGALARLAWRAKVRIALWQADVVVTVSDYSREQIQRHLGVDPGRLAVVGEASDPAFRRLPESPAPASLASMGVDAKARNLVYVGGFGPHKNLGRLIDSLADLVADPARDDVRLVLVGEVSDEVFHSEIDALRERIVDRRLADRVVFTGFVADDDLVRLLNVATALVLPSLMEGFGLPALEAAACGCPVIATRRSPLPELLGEASVYVDPHNGAELTAAIGRLLDRPDQRRRMGEAGRRAASSLTWEAAARQMMAVLDGLAK